MFRVIKNYRDISRYIDAPCQVDFKLLLYESIKDQVDLIFSLWENCFWGEVDIDLFFSFGKINELWS